MVMAVVRVDLMVDERTGEVLRDEELDGLEVVGRPD